ncbi:heterokaryon incompatibility protein-domain-containing protein [Xylaria scruposa]|nr:heterokaryon incompatibility protein-domain-containing protein [Xylaria scruposa]
MVKVLYRPLQPGEIRLVTLLPGSITSRIQCRLSYHTLDEGLRYDALSYYWGDPKITQPITLDDHSINITAELERALRHLRTPDEKRILWIDALCINQNDAVERNHQVADMFYIYQTAQRVRIWIGRESEECDSNLKEKLESLLTRYREDSKQPVQRYNLRLGLKHSRHWNALKLLELFGKPGNARDYTFDFMESSLKHPLGQKAWCDLAILACRPYWARVWIQQEIVRQTGVLVHCGRWSFPLTWLYKLHTIYTKYLDTYQDNRLPTFQKFIRQVFAYIEFLKPQKGQIEQSDYSTTINILRHQHMRRTTDPRDNIYGIVGIVAAWRGSFPVDYRLESDGVYVAAFKFITIRYGHLGLLVDQWRISSLRNLDGLPSWCPDWTINIDPASTELSSKPRNSSFWNIPGFIGGGKSNFNKFNNSVSDFYFESNDRVLVASGIELDIIEEFTGRFGNDPVLANSQGKVLHEALTLGMKSCGGPYWSFWSSYQQQTSSSQLVPPDHEKPTVSISLIKNSNVPEPHLKSHSEDQLRATMRTLVADQLLLKPYAFDHLYRQNPNKENRLENGTRDEAPDKKIEAVTRRFLQETLRTGSTPFTSDFNSYFLVPSRLRRFFVSRSKHMGLANEQIQKGDVVCILFRCPRPVVLRKVDDHYMFIGDAYFHGWMHGEAITKLQEGLLRKQCFRIR